MTPGGEGTLSPLLTLSVPPHILSPPPRTLSLPPATRPRITTLCEQHLGPQSTLAFQGLSGCHPHSVKHEMTCLSFKE